MEAVEGADQLSSEHFEAMQAAPFLAAKVEIEGAPMRVRIAGMAAEDVELLLPFGPAVSGADRVRQRPVKSVAPGDPEQFERSVVDQVRQLLDLIVEKAVAGVKAELALRQIPGGLTFASYQGEVVFDPAVLTLQDATLPDGVDGVANLVSPGHIRFAATALDGTVGAPLLRMSFAASGEVKREAFSVSFEEVTDGDFSDLTGQVQSGYLIFQR